MVVMTGCSSRLEAKVQIENLSLIASAYSEAVAGRVLCEVWLRLEACFVGADWLSGLCENGLSVSYIGNQGHDFFWSVVGDALLRASAEPVSVGGVSVVVALVVDAGRSRTLKLVIDEVQYRESMECAVALHLSISRGSVGFAEQAIVAAGPSKSVLYKERLLRFGNGDEAGQGLGSVLEAVESLWLTRALDRFVVQDTVRSLSERPGEVLGCNISALSLVNDAWWHGVISDLSEDASLASRLVIEVTETANALSLNDAVDFVLALRQVGCRIALDDFGAGNSSIPLARAIRPDIIKIDADFIRGSRNEVFGDQLLKAMIQLASQLSADVVVEGVESADDLAIATANGGEWVQGYLFGRPTPFVRSAVQRLSPRWS